MALMATLFFSCLLAYQHITNRFRLSSWVNNFVSALHFARVTAMTSHTTITLCARDSKNTCGSNWQAGQLVLDENNQHVFRVLSAVPNGYELTWKSTLGQSDALRWRANGFTRGQQGSFLLCSDQQHDNLSAQIIILRTGRVRSVIGKIPECK